MRAAHANDLPPHGTRSPRPAGSAQSTFSASPLTAEVGNKPGGPNQCDMAGLTKRVTAIDLH